MTQEEMLLEAAQTGLSYKIDFKRLSSDFAGWSQIQWHKFLYCRDYELKKLRASVSKGGRSQEKSSCTQSSLWWSSNTISL